ncbi:DEAD/DEAH box helicase [Actinopolymorpha sp. B17G11]|uniref:DEAD/DEAH box helicase n=1 Tax=unclassified Actinopolymorpha TaxID=2627063 RepID=UPI0032D93153
MSTSELPPSAAGPTAGGVARPDPLRVLSRLAAAGDRAERIVHVESTPGRPGRTAPWPDWVPREVVRRLRARGIERPWTHQVETAESMRAGRDVVVATGTASGKSLGYLLPLLADVLTPQARAGRGGRRRVSRRPREPLPGQLTLDFDIAGMFRIDEPNGRRAGPGRGRTALYLAPTKALAADQLRAVTALGGPDLPAVTYDGDSSRDYRDWARNHAAYLLTNPDMLHRSLLPGHERWARFFGSLAYVVIDECHHYRGVFGSHVAQVLRRLQRILEHHGADPVFVLASATVRAPAESAERLIGRPTAEVTEDGSPHGGLSFALWEPPVTSLRGEHGMPLRRSATSEAADLLALLVADGVRSVAFVRSRRGAELVSTLAREHLSKLDPALESRVAAYRGGYLPEERRELERALQDGSLLAVATTSALELGIDIAGLDAVLLAGYPGTRAAVWQRAGRAGRDGHGALAVFIPRNDPLDAYLVRHPEALFGPPVEATVFDPDNPYVVRPHLAAAAAELPVTDADLKRFGPAASEALAALEAEGKLRRRASGWFWVLRDRASDLTDIRSGGGLQVRLIEASTGRLLGTVDAAASHAAVHDGAVYVHQGDTYVVDRLDLDAGVAVVSAAGSDHDHSTVVRETSDVRVLASDRRVDWGEASLELGSVEVTSQVVSYLKISLSGEPLGEHPLTLPPRTLRTRAVWWTLPDHLLTAAGLTEADIPGAAHAAEHASIGLLPLFATCDRWDIGGVSTGRHADTGRPTVFVYDGHPGGAGFAERGFGAAHEWLGATRAAIAGCGCDDGCPACVQSPKCGNGNHPLDKAGAVGLLDVLLANAPDQQ